MPFIKFTSHRSRDYALQCLDRKPPAYFSYKRETGRGVYELTHQEIATIRTHSRAGGFTLLRGPYDDLMQCWGTGAGGY